MPDKVKPLKIENSTTGGTEDDMLPVEADPTEDYLTGKGFSFENSDNHLIDLLGGQIQFTDPTTGSVLLSNLLQKSVLTTKGDTYVRNGSDIVRLPVGTDTHALIADSVESSGIAWKQIQDAWVAFDPTGLPNFLGTEVDVEDALNTLGNQTFADAVNFQDFESNANQNTTSNGWVTKDTFTTDDLPAGRYIIYLSCQAGQSDKEKQFGIRLQARDGTSGTYNTVEPLNLLDAVGSDETYKLISGFGFFEKSLDDEPFQMIVQFGETDDGGTARLRQVKVLTFKVDDL